ncbi:MAG: GDP-L-fucose synthase [Petrimonas sp.]|jgi:GDP-L-fucose synthase|uniref:GDP-L-fucose synthase family protein n=1 Tax=Petrimonas sp. TaxID=2023866 RepID=UPI0030D5A0BA
MNKGSKIYIAGHNGLVGSAIRKNLQEKGYTNLIGRSHGELDLLDGAAVKAFFEKEKPEYVFLAAAYVGGIVANNTYRADFIHKNLQIQNNVIYESFRNDVKKLLFLGSTCIYPKESPQPMKEDYLLSSPLEYTNEPYAIAKIAGLKMCESFNIQYGTNYIAVMPTNLYGLNDNFHLENSHVLPAMMRKMHLGKCLYESDWEAVRKDLGRRPLDNTDEASTTDDIINALSKHGVFPAHIELWGTGRPMREFLWSEDMADACVFIMENVNFDDLKQDKKEVRNCHINIGTGREISIKDLAETIRKIIGYQGEICFDASRPDGTMRKLTDVSKLTSLGWQYNVEIGEGIGRMYNWYVTDQE